MSARARDNGRSRGTRSTALNIIGALAFLVLAVLLAGYLLRVFMPKQRLAAPLLSGSYSSDAVRAAVAPEKVRAEHERILSMGPRFLGQPGLDKTADYIRTRFREAGLEIHEQSRRTAAPQTLRREIRVEDDGAFRQPDGVEVYPFWPNHMQPMVTPPEGLTGELVLVTDEVLRTRDSFAGCIALVEAQEGRAPASCAFDWVAYASLGFSAVILANHDGVEAMPWTRIVGDPNIPAAGFINGSVPVNYVRLAATPGIFNLAGKRIRLNVETRWANVPNTTIYGILRARRPAHEAILLVANYDVGAILPDLAPGVIPAYDPAVQLCLLDGLLPYRETIERDVVFAAFSGRSMCEDGARSLVRVLGVSLSQENRLLTALGIGVGENSKDDAGPRARARLEGRLEPIEERRAENKRRAGMVETIRAAFEDPAFFAEPARSEDIVEGFDKPTRVFFDQEYAYVLDTLVLERSEVLLQAKLAFERDPDATLDGPAFKAYLAAKREYDEAQSAAASEFGRLLRNRGEFIEECRVRNRFIERLDELRAHHAERGRAIEQDIALVQAFNGYDDFVALMPGFVPARDAKGEPETVSFGGGSYLIGTPERVFEGLLAASRQRAGLEGALSLPTVDRWHDQAVWRELGTSPYGPADIFRDFGYQAFRLLNFGRSESYSLSTTPADLPFMHAVDTMQHSLALAGEVALSVAHGAGKFPAQTGARLDIKGRVLVSNVGQSIVPSYPLKNALLGTRSRPTYQQFYAPGYYDVPFTFADAYGEFDLINTSIQARSFYNRGMVDELNAAFSPIACGFGSDGIIAWMKDEGEDGQRLYKSVGIGQKDATTLEDLTIVAFRSAPVTLLDLENPQTGDLYAWVELVDREGITPLRKQCIFTVKSPFVTFVEPDKRVYAKLQAGSAESKLALTTRAFMLGSTDPNRVDEDREIDGAGYLAADTPIVRGVPMEISESMAFLNGKRIDLLAEHGMADERAVLYQEKGRALVESSREPGKSFHAARLEARDAVTYNELNHPVLRQSIGEAVIGILWYLALLVPFCFFFEKLVFGYADIRKQLAVQAVTFVGVFAMLRFLHPAFEMVQSPLMILLGFVIILISMGITVLFATKFKESLEDLRKRQGKVRAARINVLGVMGTAFLLGLNNMHRRRVRTGLTCGTLVLMTFVVICFTSVQSDIVEEAIAITKAPYQGILVKKADFEPLETVTGLISEYSDRYDLCEREMYLGQQYLGQSYNPSLDITYEPEGAPARSLKFDSIVKLAAAEPLRHDLEFVTPKKWFTPEQELDSDEPCPVLLPDAMADTLGITPDRVEQGDCPVSINGRRFVVLGIFKAESYGNLYDLDGLTLLPFDIEAMGNVAALRNSAIQAILAKDNDPRIPAENIVLCPAKRNLQIQLQYGNLQRVSLAIAMPNAPYKEAKAVIDSYLERKAEPVFYGLGGVSFRGQRTRQTSLVGLLDLLLPLMIAALTVLNTMKGSVYERRDEIFVYNAVGIAPRYVFFMFLAEAAVYAVVGSVLGYLFSQGVGRILTELDLTGGMNMAFTSITTIYASLAVSATVFISTYFPARSAMQIATPTEDAGWRLPEPEDDLLQFRLPFAFSAHDRIAILAFCERYLQDHGEGSAGRFLAAPPRMGVCEQLDPLADDGYIPRITCTVWLKPFDLGVSQEMTLAVPTDAETGEYVAEITLRRLSGTRESWMRLNVGFVRLLRQHLLHWRAVDDADRSEMFREGKEILERQLTG